MATKDVETPVVAENENEPEVELVEGPEGLEAELPTEGSPTRKERRQQRLEEYRTLEEERNRLRDENERLRSQPREQYLPPTPQPTPEEEEYGRVEARLEEIREEKQLLWKVGQSETSPAELEKLAKRADKLESERELLAGRKAMLVYRTHKPVSQQTPQQIQLQVLQGKFQDVYNDERARVKAQAIFNDAQADGEKASPELLEKALTKARAWQRAGYKTAPVVSQSLKLRTSGERSGGPSTGADNRVRVTSDVTKWAKAMYPKLSEKEAVAKYLGGQGEAVKALQQKKTG